jgi:hypothetical protein
MQSLEGLRVGDAAVCRSISTRKEDGLCWAMFLKCFLLKMLLEIFDAMKRRFLKKSAHFCPNFGPNEDLLI